MTYSFGRKKTFGEKIKSGLRRIFAVAVLGGVASGPLYYEYKTIRTVDAKVTGGQDTGTYDSNGKKTSSYTMDTDKGSFVNRASWWHLKGQDGATNIWQSTQIDTTYHIRLYGYNFGPLHANVLGTTAISDAELKAAEKAKQDLTNKMEKQKGSKAPSQEDKKAGEQQGTTRGGQATGTLSGSVVEIEMVKDGQRIKLLVPVEAAGNIEVVNVKPLVVKSPEPPSP